jgi:TrmH family RNA methyltransferase
LRAQSVHPPDEVAHQLVEVLTEGRAAIVFGPESSGLENAEVARCHYLIHIPADESYPALNLAQAASICLYELRRAWLSRVPAAAQRAPIAPFVEQERMFAHLRMALADIHFLYGPNADSLMHAIRHLIGRAQPSPMELDVLHGLARQIRWYATRHPPGPEG